MPRSRTRRASKCLARASAWRGVPGSNPGRGSVASMVKGRSSLASNKGFRVRILVEALCPWCSGLACDAVNVEAAGSIPPGHLGDCRLQILDCRLEENRIFRQVFQSAICNLKSAIHLIVLGVWWKAHDPAKVEDQVRFLTRIFDAGARRPGNRLQPGRSGFDSHRRLFGSSDICRGQRRAVLRPQERRLAACVPQMGSNQRLVSTEVSSVGRAPD